MLYRVAGLRIARMIYPDLTLDIPETITKAHFIGIGGSGMSGIARMFLERGVAVSGSDRADSPALQSLKNAGAEVFIGHKAEQIGDADTVIHTGALWPDNPEYLLAKERGLHVIHRSQALHWLISDAPLISVAGAHGKTTSTGMLVVALDELSQSPSYVNGGVIANYGVSSALGTGDLFVVEADESDGSFLLYNTAVALITNVDVDHLDHWGSQEAFDQAFINFADQASQAVVISCDDAGARRVTAALSHSNVLTFGFDQSANLRITQLQLGERSVFTLNYQGQSVEVSLPVPGAHNAVNATGVVGVLLSLGFDLDDAARAVSAFAGTGRRFELHGSPGGISVFDDYAHHPTEVEVALKAARTVVGEGRIIAVHQPHTFSRTAAMHSEFAAALENNADHTVVLEVYGAREDPVPGVTGLLVSDDFHDSSRVAYFDSWDAAAEHIAEVSQPGDFVITLGCGNVNLLVPQILEQITVRHGLGA